MHALETLLRRDGTALVVMARCWLGTGPAALDVIAEGVAELTGAAATAVNRFELRRAVLAAAIRRLSAEPERGEGALAGLLPVYDADGVRVSTAADGAVSGPHGPALLRAAVAEVPVPFRQALLLVDMEGWSRDEAAAALGVTVSVLKHRLHLARMAATTLMQRRAESAPAAA